MALSCNLSSLLDSFPTTDDKLSVLQQIKVLINSTSRKELQDDVHNISFNLIFDSLPTFNREEMQICCDVLNSLFMALSPSSVMENYSHELQQGLTVRNQSIQTLSLSQLKRLPSDLFEVYLAKNHQFLSCLLQLLAEDNLQIATSAASILNKLGDCPESLQQLFHSDLHAVLDSIIKTNDVVRFRVYELLVNIGNSSARNLSLVIGSGLLENLLNELYGDSADVLAKMNCVELLTNLTTSDHGFTWLTEHKVLDCLETLLIKADSDVLLELLQPGLITFFGSVARHRPNEICSKYQHFLSKVLSSLNSSDMTLRTIGIETIAQIAITKNGKLILKKYGSKMDEAMKNVGQTIQNCPEDVKVRALSAFASILQLTAEDQNDEMLALTQHWFSLISSNPFNLIFSIGQQPFPNIRLASKSIYVSLANQRWALELMAHHPTFIEYLLDRSTEASSEDKRLKYKVVEALLQNSCTEEMFGSPNYLKLRLYQQQGPFYVQSQPAVTMEGDC
ncbi:26S proteasome non-ATPase regulatory subunit 5 [Octopus sinensis]|uniref:26S proteasome non-ATPase regulatory subunit 5 n=1 Tax=Octopus sinensis TaxID=2607531 RepID=A0A6P7TDU4_9MOLL|nr:26S proteasome non-ATPase regulatory subunit 5 [Octopus sinensis]